MNEIKFQKGDTYRPDEDVGGSKSMWTAGIHKGGHGNAIEVYGQTQAEAEALRDIVLKGLSSPPAAAEGVPEEREFVMVGEEMLFGNAAIRHLRDELAGVRDLVRILDAKDNDRRAELARLRTQSLDHSEHSLAMVGAQAGAVPAWTEQDALAALNFDCDGPFGQSDVDEMLRFLAHIDMMRGQKVAAPPADANKGGVPEGWEFKRSGDWISVIQPDKKGVKVRLNLKDHQDAAATLYRLADALLSAAPAAPVAADENAESNFNQLMYINNWLIGRGLLSLERSEEKDGPLAPAKNITDSIQRLMAADERVLELEQAFEILDGLSPHECSTLKLTAENMQWSVLELLQGRIAALAASKADGKGGVA